MDTIKILIVDDHPMMREALILALEEEPDLRVIGEASDGQEAIALMEQLHPDVILMDLLMRGLGGLEAIARIVAADPQAKILVITSLEDEDKILAAIQAGALGYFPKTAPRAYLLEAIRKVADGVPYLPSGIAVKLFKSLREMKAPPGESTLYEPLTARQKEILTLLAEGLTDQEISQALSLEVATVRSHVHHILQRLKLETRAQATAHARKE